MITTQLIDLKRTRTNGLEDRFVRRGSRKAHPSRLPAPADASGVLAGGLSDPDVRRLGPERGKAPWKTIAPFYAEDAPTLREQATSQKVLQDGLWKISRVAY